MTKPIRLALAFLVMISGAIFAVSATVATTTASATPYGHPFTCHEQLRHRVGRVDVRRIRCSGILNGTFQRSQCRISPTPMPDPGSTRTPNICGPTVTVGPAPAAKVLIVLHSTPQVIGTFTANSRGEIDTTFTMPKGFTGNHMIEVRVVNGNNLAPVLSAKVAAQTNRVMLPVTIGKAGVVTRTSNASLPTTNDNGGFGSVAVVGIGALGVVMLLGGGLLMFTGRRRRIPA